MSAPRVATCLFCDDIRYEIGGKHSLIGIYASDMIFPVGPPITLLKWGIEVIVITDIDDIPEHIFVRVFDPFDREIVAIEDTPKASPEHLVDTTRFHWRIGAGMPPINLEAPGYIYVMIETEKGSFRAGRLLVRFSQLEATSAAANADAQPPVQSATDAPEQSSPPAPSLPVRQARRRPT